MGTTRKQQKDEHSGGISKMPTVGEASFHGSTVQKGGTGKRPKITKAPGRQKLIPRGRKGPRRNTESEIYQGVKRGKS